MLIIEYNFNRFNLDWFAHLKIVASNDINEETLYSLKEQVSSLLKISYWDCLINEK